MRLLLTAISCSIFLTSFSQPKYLKYLWGNKVKDFYWDNHDKKMDKPDNVAKELIYHINSSVKNDSVLEKEITYNQSGLPVEERLYAVPSKEGLVHIDSFLYDNKKQLIEKRRYNIMGAGLFWEQDTSIITYEYNEKGKEVYRHEAWHKHDIIEYETEYDDQLRMIKMKQWQGGYRRIDKNGNPFSEIVQVFFYTSSSANPDSVQYFYLDSLRYTSVYQYDLVADTRTIYIRYPSSQWKRSFTQYNPDKTVSNLIVWQLPSWNGSRLHDTEIQYLVSEDGTTVTCSYYLNGKKKFEKKHIYILRQE